MRALPGFKKTTQFTDENNLFFSSYFFKINIFN